YWELPEMMLQFLRNGSRAAAPALQLARCLLGNQGLRGTVGFMAAFRRAGARHKKLVETFLHGAVRGDSRSALGTLSPPDTITLGDHDTLDMAELAERVRGAVWTKVIGAGSTVAASVTSVHGRGVLFADVAPRGNEINAIRYFPS